MAKPAASSEALLILFPEESRSIAVLSSTCDEANERCAFIDAVFVLITIAIFRPPKLTFGGKVLPVG